MPETVSEKPAPEIKAEADTSISVGTTDGENAVPASKVVSLLLCFNKKYNCYKSRVQVVHTSIATSPFIT